MYDNTVLYDNTVYCYTLSFQNTILYQNLYLKGSTLYTSKSTKLPSTSLKSLKSNLIYYVIQAFTNMDTVNR